MLVRSNEKESDTAVEPARRRLVARPLLGTLVHERVPESGVVERGGAAT